jgi:hypothetical protein
MLNSVKLYNKYKDDYEDFKKLYGINKQIEFEYNKILLIVLLQYHLIEIGYRNLAQVEIKLKKNIKEFITNIDNVIKKRIFSYLDENQIPYYKISSSLIYIYNPKKYKISDLKLLNDEGVNVAKNLGDFYMCAAKLDEWKKYYKRIAIFIGYLEIYAQMCKEEQISENMPTFFKIFKELYHIFYKLDKELVINNNIRIELYNDDTKLKMIDT